MSGQVPPILVSPAAPASELAAWASALPRPRGVIAIGPGWKPPALSRGAAASASAELAYELHSLLSVMREPGRDVDPDLRELLHGMFGELPILELSLVLGATPRALFAIGRKIGGLASRGVLLAGFGSWTLANDAWVANTLADAAVEELLDWRRTAPAPGPMTLDALFVVAGAASLFDHAVGFPVRGENARCIQFGR